MSEDLLGEAMAEMLGLPSVASVRRRGTSLVEVKLLPRGHAQIEVELRRIAARAEQALGEAVQLIICSSAPSDLAAPSGPAARSSTPAPG